MKKTEVTTQNNFEVQKDAPFERCVDFMVKMIEKYAQEIGQNGNKVAS